MQHKSRVLNGALILILILMLGWGGLTWLVPKYPDTVDGHDFVSAPKELTVPVLSRQVYSKSVVNDVAHLNLFRKQRRKYYQAKPPKPIPQITRPLPNVAVAPPTPPSKPTAPPPQLVLTGVVLFDNQKVAIFEGTYSEVRGGRLVQNLKPRRRGYKIGETLGDYQVNTIERSHATTQKNKTVSSSFPRRVPTLRNPRRQAAPPQRNFNRGTPPPAATPPNQKRLPGLRNKPNGF